MANQAPPTSEQVKRQLLRLLKGKRFSNAPTQAPMLEFVTKRALAGKSSPEEIIAKALFPNYIKDETSDVRVTANKIRKTLRSYYENEGSGDLVVIKFPDPSENKRIRLKEGEAYTPRFTYNPKHEAQKLFRMAQAAMSRGLSWDLTARNLIGSGLSTDPIHVDLSLLFVQWVIARMLVVDRDDTENHFQLAIQMLAGARKNAPSYWLSYALEAYIKFGWGDIDGAMALFKEAKRRDKNVVQVSFWYIDCLLRLARYDEVIEYLTPSVESNVETYGVFAWYATALISLGRIEEAEYTLQLATRLRNDDTDSLMLLAYVCKKQGREREVNAALRTARILLGDQDFELRSSLIRLPIMVFQGPL